MRSVFTWLYIKLQKGGIPMPKSQKTDKKVVALTIPEERSLKL